MKTFTVYLTITRAVHYERTFRARDARHARKLADKSLDDGAEETWGEIDQEIRDMVIDAVEETR